MTQVAVFDSVEEAVAELRRHPQFPVIAHCEEMDVELRAIAPQCQPPLGDALAALGPWEGESTEELQARLKEARAAGLSDDPPQL